MPSEQERIAVIRKHLRLEGEDLVRIRTGKVTNPPKGNSLTISVGQITAKYHRAKFLLAYGWLPKNVDHKDVNRQNNLLSNYRNATEQQNRQNRRPQRRKHDLPRGVSHSHCGKRFCSSVRHNKKLHHLGTYDTPEEASQVAEAFRKPRHGEFYRDPQCQT